MPPCSVAKMSPRLELLTSRTKNAPHFFVKEQSFLENFEKIGYIIRVCLLATNGCSILFLLKNFVKTCFSVNIACYLGSFDSRLHACGDKMETAKRNREKLLVRESYQFLSDNQSVAITAKSTMLTTPSPSGNGAMSALR